MLQLSRAWTFRLELSKEENAKLSIPVEWKRQCPNDILSTHEEPHLKKLLRKERQFETVRLKTGTPMSHFCGNQTAVSVSRRNRKAARAACFFCSASILVLCNALVAILTLPSADSIPNMSARLLPAFLHSAACPVTSCNHSFPTHPAVVRKRNSPSRSKMAGVCQCQPTNRRMVCTQPPDHRTSYHHSHCGARRARAQRTLQSLLCHAPQLAQAVKSFTAQSLGNYFCVSCRHGALISLRVNPPKDRWPNQARNQNGFCHQWQW